MSEHLINNPPIIQPESRETGDPAPAQSNASRLHNSPVEAVQAVQEAFTRAQGDGRWMVAVWSVADGEIKLRTWTTWEYPRSDFEESTRMLKRHMQHEGRLPVNQPLPTAELAPIK